MVSDFDHGLRIGDSQFGDHIRSARITHRQLAVFNDLPAAVSQRGLLAVFAGVRPPAFADLQSQTQRDCGLWIAECGMWTLVECETVLYALLAVDEPFA